MWTSSDHYLAPPPPPGGRGRLWSALLLLAVGVVTLAVLTVVAIAVVLGGYQEPRELPQQGPPKRIPPSTTWGEESIEEKLPTRMHTHQRLQTTVRHHVITTQVPSTTSSTTSTTTTTTTTSTTTTNAPKLPTFQVQGSVDFELQQPQQNQQQSQQLQQKDQQQRRDWNVESYDREWRLGEAAVIQDPSELSATDSQHLPARSYIGIKGDRVMPTLFPPTSTDLEPPRLVGTTDIPAFDLGMIDSISKSFTNMAIRVRPQHPLQPPIYHAPTTREPIPSVELIDNNDTLSEPNLSDLRIESESSSDKSIPANERIDFENASGDVKPILDVQVVENNETIPEADVRIVTEISPENIETVPSIDRIDEIIIPNNMEIIPASKVIENNETVVEPIFSIDQLDFETTTAENPSDQLMESNNEPVDSQREEKSVVDPIETANDVTENGDNDENVTLANDTTVEAETTTDDGEETTTEEVDDINVDITPLPSQQQMTSRAAVERTAKQDTPGGGSQLVQREPKGSVIQAFPSSEFNNSPAFLRNRKRNVTTTTPRSTSEADTKVKNCTCGSRLEAQGLSRKICDGVLDCWDYSDEERCEWCAPGRYVCAHSRACVPKHKLCDGRRDCPFGDDERNCVAVAPDRQRADALEYHDSGLLMVQKAGVWGTLCVEKLEGSAWRLGDVARAVCRALTYSDFELAEQVQVTRSAGPYYELNLQNARHGGSSSVGGSPRLAVESSDCPSRAAVRLGCRDLQCGIRPLAGNQWASPPPRRRGSRIVGGGNAGPGAWPWQAALYKEGQFQCGGSLVAAHWILSASHCFAHNLDAYWVARLGALRRGTDLASPFEQLRRIVRIVQHPGYLDHGFINDLALLRLEKPVQFSDYIRPVCLPLPDSAEPGPEGQMCTVVGWGQLSEVGRIFPDTLQEVQLPLISTEECRKRTLFLPLYRVTEDMFCAGFERGGRDACLGDSGGPLMCQRSDARWELTGITSNGYGCARANRPGVYTKVANYVRWIAQVMDSDRADNMTAPACPSGQQRCALGHCSAPPDGSCGKLYCPAA